MWIEQLLQLQHRRPDLLVLATQQPRPTATGGMFAADQAAASPHRFGDLLAERSQPPAIFGRCQIEERPNVQLSVSGMRENGRSDLKLLQHILDRGQCAGQRFRRHPNVFDQRHGAVITTHSIKPGDHAT